MSTPGSFGFGASSSPFPPPKSPIRVQTPDEMGGLPPTLWQAIADKINAGTKTAQQNQDLKEGAIHGRHLGLDGTPVQKSGPWGDAPLKFQSTAADLSPRQLAQSQGGNAINQWKFPDMFGPNHPSGITQAEGAMHAGAPTHMNPMNNPAPLTGPGGNAQTDAADVAQAKALFAPGGSLVPPPAPDPSALGTPFGSGSVTQMPPPPRRPLPNTGAAFGFPQQSPAPGFSFSPK